MPLTHVELEQSVAEVRQDIYGNGDPKDSLMWRLSQVEQSMTRLHRLGWVFASAIIVQFVANLPSVLRVIIKLGDS